MESENLFCSNTFYSIDYFLGCIIGNPLNQEMDVIPINTYFKKVHLIALFYGQTNFFKSGRHRLCQNFSPILYWANKMIEQQTLIMTLMNMFTHIHKVTYLYATPEACLLYTSPSPRDGLLSRMPS